MHTLIAQAVVHTQIIEAVVRNQLTTLHNHPDALDSGVVQFEALGPSAQDFEVTSEILDCFPQSYRNCWSL